MRETSGRPVRASSESGFALVVLLLVTLFVALVGLAMMNGTVSEVQIAVTESNTVQARYLAEAGIAAAAAQLAVSNTWTGPLTQTLGSGSYTVQVDTTASQAGATGALKSVVSTGSVANTPAGAGQTIRETFLVLPQAFSKAMVSDTTITTANAQGGQPNPAIANTVLRQLGTIHANNVLAAGTAVTLQGTGGADTGQVTASQGTITIAAGTSCYGCAPATNQAVIPFPSMNFAGYCNTASAAGTLFTTQASFNTYVTNHTSGGVATLGSPSAPVVIFVEVGTGFQMQGAASIQIYGTFIVYVQGNTAGECNFSAAVAPSGNLGFNMNSSALSVTFTAVNNEPAIMVGGSIFTNRNSCTTPNAEPTITVRGLVYVMDDTTNPATTAPASPGGVCLYGSGGGGGLATFTGAIVSNSLAYTNFDSLTYDPSIFFQGLPSGLNSPGPPFVLLPISWTSGK